MVDAEIVVDQKRLLVLEGDQLEGLWPDGPGLKVKQKEKSAVRFPFRRLEAIYLVGEFDSGLYGFLSALSEGVPTFFMNRKGKVKGMLLPPNGQNALFRQQLEWLKTWPCGEELIAEWRDNQWRHDMSLEGCSLPVGTSPVELERVLRRDWQTMLGKDRFLEIEQQLEAWEYTHLIRVMHQVGLKPDGSIAPWLRTQLSDALHCLVLQHLYQLTLPTQRTSGKTWFAWLGVLDGWISRRVYTWMASLELMLTEWVEDYG